jgi:hypothetical protein
VNTPVPSAEFWKDFWQLDLFGSREGVSRKQLAGSQPAGYEEQPEPRPFSRGRSRSR